MGNLGVPAPENTYTCPVCGYPMTRMSTYDGGTATQRIVGAVAATGSSAQFLYHQQEEYECTNPQCRMTLLRLRRATP